MARRNRENESSTTPEEVATEATPTESQEDTSMTVTDESTSTTTESEASATEEKAAEVEIDLTAFTAAVESAVAGRDEASGDPSEEAILAAQTEYRALDGLKAKNAAKKLVEEKMREAMNSRDIHGARAYMLVSDNLTAGASGSKASATPADPKEAFTQRVQALLLAQTLLADQAPEGITFADVSVTDEQTDAARALLAHEQSDAEDKGDAPEASAVVKAAVKLATGKAARVGGTGRSGGTFTGERKDIGKHIAEAFAAVEPGTFLTIAQIRSHKSEEYGDNPPSAGAISARLFPQSGKCTVEGVQPGQNSDSRKGATKVA